MTSHSFDVSSLWTHSSAPSMKKEVGGVRVRATIAQQCFRNILNAVRFVWGLSANEIRSLSTKFLHEVLEMQAKELGGTDELEVHDSEKQKGKDVSDEGEKTKEEPPLWSKLAKHASVVGRENILSKHVAASVQLVLDGLCILLRVTDGVVLVEESGKETMKSIACFSGTREYERKKFSFPRNTIGIVNTVMRSGIPVSVRDSVFSPLEYRAAGVEDSLPYMPRSLMCWPLLLLEKDGSFGVLLVMHKHEKMFSNRHETSVDAVASVLSKIILRPSSIDSLFDHSFPSFEESRIRILKDNLVAHIALSKRERQRVIFRTENSFIEESTSKAAEVVESKKEEGKLETVDSFLRTLEQSWKEKVMELVDVENENKDLHQRVKTLSSELQSSQQTVSSLEDKVSYLEQQYYKAQKRNSKKTITFREPKDDVVTPRTITTTRRSSTTSSSDRKSRNTSHNLFQLVFEGIRFPCCVIQVDSGRIWRFNRSFSQFVVSKLFQDPVVGCSFEDLGIKWDKKIMKETENDDGVEVSVAPIEGMYSKHAEQRITKLVLKGTVLYRQRHVCTDTGVRIDGPFLALVLEN